MIGAALMLFAGVLFAVTTNYILLVIAATIGVISPSGNEVGPFLPSSKPHSLKISQGKSAHTSLPGTCQTSRWR